MWLLQTGSVLQTAAFLRRFVFIFGLCKILFQSVGITDLENNSHHCAINLYSFVLVNTVKPTEVNSSKPCKIGGYIVYFANYDSLFSYFGNVYRILYEFLLLQLVTYAHVLRLFFHLEFGTVFIYIRLLLALKANSFGHTSNLF